jgi:hypothetical protein
LSCCKNIFFFFITGCHHYKQFFLVLGFFSNVLLTAQVSMYQITRGYILLFTEQTKTILLYFSTPVLQCQWDIKSYRTSHHAVQHHLQFSFKEYFKGLTKLSAVCPMEQITSLVFGFTWSNSQPMMAVQSSLQSIHANVRTVLDPFPVMDETVPLRRRAHCAL